MWSGQFLHYHSHHPLNYKINVIKNLLDRGITLAHKSFHKKKYQKNQINFTKKQLPTWIFKFRYKKEIKPSFEKCFHPGGKVGFMPEFMSGSVPCQL